MLEICRNLLTNSLKNVLNVALENVTNWTSKNLGYWKGKTYKYACTLKKDIFKTILRMDNQGQEDNINETYLFGHYFKNKSWLKKKNQEIPFLWRVVSQFDGRVHDSKVNKGWLSRSHHLYVLSAVTHA